MRMWWTRIIPLTKCGISWGTEKYTMCRGFMSILKVVLFVFFMLHCKSGCLPRQDHSFWENKPWGKFVMVKSGLWWDSLHKTRCKMRSKETCSIHMKTQQILLRSCLVSVRQSICSTITASSYQQSCRHILGSLKNVYKCKAMLCF